MNERKETKSVTKRRLGAWPFEEAERWYEHFFPRALWRSFPPEWPVLRSAPFEHRMPAVDVIDRDKEVLVRAEVPGVRKEDLNISVSDSTLTISGHTRQEEEEKREDYYCHELSYGEFTRTLDLPAEVDTDKAKARIEDGVLEIELPKVESAKRREVKLQVQ